MILKEVLPLLILATFCSCLVITETSNVPELEKSAVKTSLAAPKLFDFARFKSVFKKSYGSLREELAREKIFMSRAFHAFLSFVSYKHHKSTHFERINQRSDMTDEELRSLENPVQDDLANLVSKPIGGEQQHSEVSEGEIEEKVAEISKSDNPAQIAAQVGASQIRRKRELSTEHTKVELKHYDHRDSGCISPIKNQEVNCASSSIFSTTALYEFQYCKESGHLVGLSEQYPIDCGDRTGMEGCNGGHEIHASLFYHDYGFELAQKYPYRAKKHTCPYGPSVDPFRMGSLRVLTPKLYAIEPEEFGTYISRSPIVISFCSSFSFHSYGGGVDSGDSCNHSRSHSMVIVGSGVENNLEYWLIRNSFGTSWGEQGYYKLSKKAHHCIRNDGQGYVLNRETNKRVFDGENPLNDGEAVRKNVHRGLKNTLKDLATHL